MRLIFVYNATLSLDSLAKEFAAEVLKRRPAECQLCSITYSLAFKKRAWKAYLGQLPLETKFYLKDQFLRKYQHTGEGFPAAFLEKEGNLRLLISADVMNALESVEQLTDLLDQKLKEEGIFS
jgi:hypothetical protein